MQECPAVLEGGGLFGGRRFRFASLASTNQWALDQAAELNHGDVVTADAQTAGRGRFGRTWVSPAGRALACSVVFDAERLGEALPALLGQVAALAVRTALSSLGVTALLKWPNDVVAQGRKLCGILLEQDDERRRLVLGIGVNVNLAPADLAGVEREPAPSSIMIELGREIPVDTACESILRELATTVTRVLSDGPGCVPAAWQRHDALDGRRVALDGPHGRVCGRYLGLNRDGRARLRDDDGRERLFWSGDVTVA